jgi:hypothetical protein
MCAAVEVRTTPTGGRMKPLAWFVSIGAMTASTALAVGAQRSDTTVIRVGTPRHPGVATLVEELTLGNGSTADEYTFSRVKLSAGRDGSVYIVDVPSSMASSVRHYDRNGKYLRTIGRNGQGPGEYVYMVGTVRDLPDGRILLTDSRGILVYSEAGEPLARWPAKAGPMNLGSGILMDHGGFVYSGGVETQRPTGPGVMPTSLLFLYRFRADGTLVDSVMSPANTFPDPARMERVTVPFIPVYYSAWSPRGYWVTSYAATYAVDLRQPARLPADGAVPSPWVPGDRVISIRRSIPPVPVQDAERSDWRQSITMFMRSGGATPNWQWSGPDIPRVKPPIRAISVDGDGRIWVRLSQPAKLSSEVLIRTRPATPTESYGIDARDRWVEPWVFDVYEPSGAYVGQVRLPDGVTSHAVDGDIVWAAVPDADDVPVVKRYRIRWGR